MPTTLRKTFHSTCGTNQRTTSRRPLGLRSFGLGKLLLCNVCLLSGKDAAAVLPTGSGKSLAYFLMALGLATGAIIVVVMFSLVLWARY